MRITIGSGNNRQSVSVASGKAYRDTHHAERQRFQRDFCNLAGIDRNASDVKAKRVG